MLHSVEGPALLSSEVCRAVTGGGAAGLEPQSVPGTVEAAPGRGREVTVSHCPPHPATTRPGAGAPAGPGSPGPVLPGSDRVAGHTLGPQAPPLRPAGSAVCPGHVLGSTPLFFSYRCGTPKSFTCRLKTELNSLYAKVSIILLILSPLYY